MDPHGLLLAAIWLIVSAAIIGLVGYTQHRRRHRPRRHRVPEALVTIRLKGEPAPVEQPVEEVPPTPPPPADRPTWTRPRPSWRELMARKRVP